MRKYFLLSLLVLVIALITFWGCKKSESSLPATFSKSTLPVITLKNEILCFTSMNDFFEAQYQASRNKDFALPVGFKPLFDVYNQVVLAENKHQDAYESLTQSEKNVYPAHSNVYFNALRDGVIYEYINTYDGETYTTYDCNSNLLSAALLLNASCLIYVKDTLIQFTHDKMKVIVDGDLGKVTLLSSMNTTDESKGIYVYTIENQTTEVQDRSTANFDRQGQQDNTSYSSTKWQRKVITQMHYATVLNTYWNSWNITFELKVKAERKKTFGGGWEPFNGTLQLVCESYSEVNFTYDSYNSGQVYNTSVHTTTLLPHGSYSLANWPPPAPSGGGTGAPTLYSAEATGTLWTTNPALSCMVNF